MRRAAAGTAALLCLLLSGCTASSGVAAHAGGADVTPSTTTISASTPPSGTGCAPTEQRMPAGAFSAPIADVDGDGRPDIEWAVQEQGGTVRFGVATASGASVSAEQGFAGGGARSFVVGTLASGVVVALTSEGRESPVWTFSDCRFRPLDGKDLLPGSTSRTPFVLYSEEAAGAGGCFDGRLGMVQRSSDTEGRGDVMVRFVDVSSDGRDATLTTETAVVARDVDFDTDPARARHFGGVSCDPSEVLHPVVRK